MPRIWKVASWAYLLAVAILGALLIELLTENGADHLAAVRDGPGHPGTFAYLNDRLYLPAALISIAIISRFVERKAPRFILTGVLFVAALVMLFGHLL
jgi:hypothetical protein